MPRALAVPKRNSHEGRLLALLRDLGPLSRARLSEITGLSPTTITKAVTPLITQGLLTETADVAGRIGRPAITLTPIPEAVSVCGVQIGVGAFRIGIADAMCNVRDVVARDFDPGLPVDDVISMIVESVEEILDRGHGAPCIGIGVGAPGPVDAEQRSLRLSVNLKWRDVAIADKLEDRLGLPSVVDHNVRSMALAEFRYRSHDVDSLAYLYVKNGVGLGVAVRGQPFYGGSSGESYIGHTRVVENGLVCSCGSTGCLDTLVSEPYLVHALRAIIPEGRHKELARDVLAVLESEATDGNVKAAALREEFIGHLAAALAVVTNLFTPRLVLVGGILSAAPQPLMADLEDRTCERIFPLLREGFRLERAEGSDNAAVAGAAAIALEAFHYAQE